MTLCKRAHSHSRCCEPYIYFASDGSRTRGVGVNANGFGIDRKGSTVAGGDGVANRDVQGLPRRAFGGVEQRPGKSTFAECAVRFVSAIGESLRGTA